MPQGKYTLVPEDAAALESRGARHLGRRMAALVGLTLCGAVAAVLLLVSGEGAVPTPTSVGLEMKVFNTPLEGTEFTLNTYPAHVHDGGDLVVSWQGQTPSPLTSRDYLTLSCGPTTGEGDYLLKKGVQDTDADDHSVRFEELFMLRCNYTAVYFQYQEKTGKHNPVARVEVSMKEPIETPKHGHLSLTDDETAMAVMFNSGSSKTPMVKYGENPQALKLHVTGTSTTYKADDL